jgi:DNA-binding NtrC family response regulator
MNDVLVVDDEAGMRTALVGSFAGHGWQVESASGVQDALTRFRLKRHSLVVTDIRMNDGDGLAVMRGVRALEPQTAVVLLTAYASVPDAVAAVREGACDYLVKPVVFEQLEETARRVLNPGRNDRTRNDRTRNDKTRNERSASGSGNEIVGHSAIWLRTLERARQAAVSDADILIQAESGSGKEVVARLIHACSARCDRPFIAVNCAAFPEHLLESELFGHAKGAFTGALGARAGKFELAHGGTLLLDEAGELPLLLQPKLLRALQEREFDRLGDTRPVKVDIRVIATTNRPLEAMVREGAFRADLYYRLNVIPLRLPPLRERREDVRELAEYFAGLYAGKGRDVELDPQLIALMQQQSWPGNVRELANLMRRAVALSPRREGREVLGAEILQAELLNTELLNNELAAVEKIKQEHDGVLKDDAFPLPEGANGMLQPGMSLGRAERELIEATLEATGGNRSRAAEMLGVSLRTVRNKVRQYGLPPKRSYVHD